MANQKSQIKNSFLTKLSGIVLILIILVILNLFSLIVSYYILHSVTGFLNSNFILLISVFIIILFGSILNDLDSKIRYISTIFYALSGVLFLTIFINAIIEFEYKSHEYYFDYLHNNYILIYLIVFFLSIFISYYISYTRLSKSQFMATICKFNVFSFCLFMQIVFFVKKEFEKSSKSLQKITNYTIEKFKYRYG